MRYDIIALQSKSFLFQNKLYWFAVALTFVNRLTISIHLSSLILHKLPLNNL